jgi:hypothetical protein
MPKLAAIYAIFSLVLFGALFAAFYVSGLGTPSEEWEPVVKPPTDEPEIRPIDLLAAGLDHPALEPGKTYRVSHETKLYIEPADGALAQEVLPDRSYFTVESTVDAVNRRWYRVTVSDGARDFFRFVLAKDLNFKRVTEAKSDVQIQEERRRELIEGFRAELQARREARMAALPPEPPKPRVPETFDEWWSMTAHRMGGATAATIAASGIAAAIATALTIGSIITLVTLRLEHTWERPPMHDGEAQWAEPADDEVAAEDHQSASRRW